MSQPNCAFAAMLLSAPRRLTVIVPEIVVSASSGSLIQTCAAVTVVFVSSRPWELLLIVLFTVVVALAPREVESPREKPCTPLEPTLVSRLAA